MKIGIVSDTHGDFEGWQRAWEMVLSECDVIFHCGDILYHGPKFDPGPGHAPKKLFAALNDLSVPLIIVRGNGDSEVDSMVLDTPIQSPYAFAQIEGTRYLAAHGHITPAEELVDLAAQWGVDYLLTGHLHVPSVETAGGVTHINPGTTTYPLAKQPDLAVPTCAYIEDDQVTVLNLQTGEPLAL